MRRAAGVAPAYNPVVPPTDLQALCEHGQRLLMSTDYLGAEAALCEAEALALRADDLDTLARLYMPLQEARRQARQRCGEGVVHLRHVARSALDPIDPVALVRDCPHGQLLVAGWASLSAAAAVRRLARQRRLYLETFLAAAYSVDGRIVVAIAPLETAAMPEDRAWTDAAWRAALPANCLVLPADDLPPPARGSTATYATTMALWERLHAPFLRDADDEPDDGRAIELYRLAIEVDPGCELAHQRLAQRASRRRRAQAAST